MDPEVLLEALAVEQELWAFCVAVELCRESTEENLHQPARSWQSKVHLGHPRGEKSKPHTQHKAETIHYRYQFLLNMNNMFKGNNRAMLELSKLLQSLPGKKITAGSLIHQDEILTRELCCPFVCICIFKLQVWGLRVALQAEEELSSMTAVCRNPQIPAAVPMHLILPGMQGCRLCLTAPNLHPKPSQRSQGNSYPPPPAPAAALSCPGGTAASLNAPKGQGMKQELGCVQTSGLCRSREASEL